MPLRKDLDSFRVVLGRALDELTAVIELSWIHFSPTAVPRATLFLFFLSLFFSFFFWFVSVMRLGKLEYRHRFRKDYQQHRSLSAFERPGLLEPCNLRRKVFVRCIRWRQDGFRPMIL